MKISVDDVELFTLSETQKKVIKNDIQDEVFEEDMKRRIKYILTHKYEQSLKRLKDEWIPRLSSKLSSIPTNDEALAQLIMSQPEYKYRSQKEVQQ